MTNFTGNVTPIPTTGELEELSVEEEILVAEDIRPISRQDSRATPLKSLLKKASFNNEETFGSIGSDLDAEDGKVSPKKVNFSEIDQVKLMSQDSLISFAPSEGSDVPILPITICKTVMSTTPIPSVARIVTDKLPSGQGDLPTELGTKKMTKPVLMILDMK